MNELALRMHDLAARERGYILAASPGPPPGPVVAGQVTPCYRREVLRPEGNRDWLLSFTLKGRAYFKQPEQYLEVGPGDLLLAEPGAYLHYAPVRDTGGWDCLWVHFNPRPAWLDALKLPRAGKGISCFHVAQAKQRKPIELALRRCVDYAHFASAGDMYGGFGQELALAALEEAVFLVGRELTLSGGSAALSEPVRKVVDLLDRHLAQEHSLTALAREARLSPSRLTHRFKEETGESVIGYLMKLRLRRAAQMLQLPERSVKEVAFSVGFRSPFYFSRQFRNHFNTSPQEFQRRALASPKPRSTRSNTRKKKQPL